MAGSDNYQAHCASCHGVNLEGQPNWRKYKADGSLPAPPHDETGHTWHHDTKMLFEYTKFGGQATLEAAGVTGYHSGMPAYEGILSDIEIWEILAYIRSTWPQEIQDAHATRHPMSLDD
jgi:mono/diheme cytochrome c family protein